MGRLGQGQSRTVSWMSWITRVQKLIDIHHTLTNTLTHTCHCQLLFCMHPYQKFQCVCVSVCVYIWVCKKFPICILIKNLHVQRRCFLSSFIRTKDMQGGRVKGGWVFAVFFALFGGETEFYVAGGVVQLKCTHTMYVQARISLI